MLKTNNSRNDNKLVKKPFLILLIIPNLYKTLQL